MRLRSGKARTAMLLLSAWASLSGTTTPALAAANCPRTTEVALESKLMCQVCGVPLALANSLEAGTPPTASEDARLDAALSAYSSRDGSA